MRQPFLPDLREAVDRKSGLGEVRALRLVRPLERDDVLLVGLSLEVDNGVRLRDHSLFRDEVDFHLRGAKDSLELLDCQLGVDGLELLDGQLGVNGLELLDGQFGVDASVAEDGLRRKD